MTDCRFGSENDTLLLFSRQVQSEPILIVLGLQTRFRICIVTLNLITDNFNCILKVTDITARARL